MCTAAARTSILVAKCNFPAVVKGNLEAHVAGHFWTTTRGEAEALRMMAETFADGDGSEEWAEQGRASVAGGMPKVGTGGI